MCPPPNDPMEPIEPNEPIEPSQPSQPNPNEPSPGQPGPGQPGETPFTEPQPYPIHPEIPVQPIHENDPTRC